MMILHRKHVGCLDLPEKETSPWLKKVAGIVTHTLANNPESVRHGEFYLFPMPYEPGGDAGDSDLLLLATTVVAAGWPAVALKRTQTDCGETKLILIMLYQFPPSWVPDEHTYTPHVLGAPAENLKLETKTWTLFQGSKLHTVPNPYYRAV